MPTEFATPVNTPLTVSASEGVLVEYPAGSTANIVQPPPATQAYVALSNDGAFTLTPVTGYVGITSWLFSPTVLGVMQAPVYVQVMIGDAVIWAHQVSGAEGNRSVDGTAACQTTWQVRADAVWTTAAEILASGKLPKRGEPLYRYRQESGIAGRSRFAKSYAKDVVANPNLTVVNHTCRQDKNDPRIWEIVVHYAGVDDPTALIADVQSQDSEYQEYQSYDMRGRLILNSAFDPISGGMPVDRAVKSIHITRNLPWEAWDMDRGETYRNTLNLAPFVLSQQVRYGYPVLLPIGTVRLKKTSERRMVRSQTSSATTARFYWQVSAELVVDRRTFRPSAGAEPELMRHRWVVADCGFNEIRDGKKMAINFGPNRPTEPQLLDQGVRMNTNPSSFPPLLNSDWQHQPATEVDFYETMMNAVLEVPPAQGVLINDSNGADQAAVSTGLPAEQGTLEFHSDGSFVYTPAAGFVGYASFTYVAYAGIVGPSLPTTVVIVVGAVPKLLAFDRYPYANWSPELDPLLADW